MIKRGIYLASMPNSYFEEHGGVSIRHDSFMHICFFYPEKKVGLYRSESKWFLPFDKPEYLDYRGEIISNKKNQIAFFINDPFMRDKIIFEGTFLNGDKLKLKGNRSSEPDKIWIESEFNYIGTGK